MKNLEFISLSEAPSVVSLLPPHSTPLASVGPADNRHLSFSGTEEQGPWPQPGSSAAASICRLFRNSVSHQEKELYLISPLPT